MKCQAVLLGLALCLAAQAAGKPGQDAPMSKSAPAAPQSLTGCIDEQYGQYVLLDNQMLKITNLQSAGTEKEVFAKFVGHKVQVRGTKSSGPKGTFTVTGIEQIADNCSQAR
jgi:hypothetical protein